MKRVVSYTESVTKYLVEPFPYIILLVNTDV